MSDLVAALRPHWDAAWSDIGVAPRADLYGEVAGRYLDTGRAYHTLRHLQECFALFETARSLCPHPGEVGLALWFHDAIYNPRSRESEALSGALAEKLLKEAGASAEVVERVRELILATRHEAIPQSEDARILVDIDLSILAADPARFDEYEAQVRKEYAHVPELLFRMGRAKILQGFLARPSIYSTRELRDRFEACARANLQLSLARLRA